MNCLVTGASGFIGSHLVKRLSQSGHHVRAVHHESPFRFDHENIDSITADMTNPSSLSNLVQEGDVVFHCAGLVKDFGSSQEIIKANFHGTQYLAEACRKKIQRFIFLGHLHTLATKKRGAYSRSKALAEEYLLQQYRDDDFPVVIIRPGNVYGPGATTWCLRPLQAIQQDRIALINHGAGLFLHTYIENLLDALLSALTTSHIEGEVFDITDGDNSTTWKTYLNDLAALAGKPPISRNISKTPAWLVSQLMMVRYYLFDTAPLLSPTAVRLFTNTTPVSIEKATKLLGYTPAIDYTEAMRRIALWLKTEQYI